MNTTLEKLGKFGVVPVVVLDDVKDAAPLAKALCDGPQSLTPEQFDNTMKKIKKIRRFMETEMN